MPTIGQPVSFAEWSFTRSNRAARLTRSMAGGLADFALEDEHSPDPAMCPYNKLVNAERREKLIVGAAAGVTGIYHYFEAQRLVEKHLFHNNTTFHRVTPKIGVTIHVHAVRQQIQTVLWSDHTALNGRDPSGLGAGRSSKTDNKTCFNRCSISFVLAIPL